VAQGTKYHVESWLILEVWITVGDVDLEVLMCSTSLAVVVIVERFFEEPVPQAAVEAVIFVKGYLGVFSDGHYVKLVQIWRGSSMLSVGGPMCATCT